jgi:hypothetical protein
MRYTSADAGVCAADVPRRAAAIVGKSTVESRPAATSAAADTGDTASTATPICAAVTMNGSDVAGGGRR